MIGSLNQGVFFLIGTLFDMFVLLLVVRFMLAYVGANYFDPVTQFVVKLSDWLVKPLRRLCPNVRRIEVSTLIIIFALQLIKFTAGSIIVLGGFPSILSIGLLAVSDMIKLFIQFFFYAILIQVIMSWLQPGSPVMYTLYQLTSPIMRPIQRVIPPIAGIDISPIPAMLGLQFLLIVLVNPLTYMAASLS